MDLLIKGFEIFILLVVSISCVKHLMKCYIDGTLKAHEDLNASWSELVD